MWPVLGTAMRGAVRGMVVSSYYSGHYSFYALTQLGAERGVGDARLKKNNSQEGSIMRKSFVFLMISLGAVALTGSLSGCVVAPAAPGYYGYGGDYYAPGYAYYPGYYAEPSVGIGIGFGGGWHGHGGGWRH
ncbi:hypothetical protein [Trinickia dinghuensis]